MSPTVADFCSLSRKIWLLAAPLMLATVSIPLLGIIDTLILGRLDHSSYLGAVSVGSNLMTLVLWTFSFLRTSTTGLSAQQHGANQTTAVLETVLRALLLGCLICLVLWLARDLLLGAGLRFVGASPVVDSLAREYAEIRFLSMPAVLGTYCLTGWLIGLQRTGTVMLVVISTNLINIVLDLVFIVGFGWNSAGAAWATVVAEYSGFAIALVVFLTPMAKFAKVRWQAISDARALQSVVSLNGNLMIRTLCLLFCFLFFTAVGARQSDDVLAANAILLQLVLLAAFALDGLAHAAESLCGYSIGQRNLDSFRETVRACMIWSLGSSVAITLFLFGLQDLVITQYSTIDAVREELAIYFPWLLFLPLAGVLCYLLDGVFIGAAQAGAMRNGMLASTVLVFLPVWYLTRDWGNHGLWFAFVLFHIARGVTLGLYYRHFNRSQRWLSHSMQFARVD